MLERDWNPGPEWQRIPGGWRHPDGRVVSDWFPYESNRAVLDVSKLTGEVTLAVQGDDSRPVVHFKIQR